jgi:2-C-methyl-D-erythritol 4-phosphate cytidylyltransferase
VWVIVVAAGSGARFGARKQYESLGDRRVLDWSIEAARAVADGLVLVVPAGFEDGAATGQASADRVVAGGATRSASVRAGLDAVPDDAGVIVVHDAARPRATPALFHAVIDAVRAGADGAVPGVAVADTLKRVRDGVVLETVDRAELVAVQTPQAFLAGVLRGAHAGAADATDDGALVEATGGRVVVVPGDPDNLKITSAADLERLRAALT